MTEVVMVVVGGEKITERAFAPPQFWVESPEQAIVQALEVPWVGAELEQKHCELYSVPDHGKPASMHQAAHF